MRMMRVCLISAVPASLICGIRDVPAVHAHIVLPTSPEVEQHQRNCKGTTVQSLVTGLEAHLSRHLQSHGNLIILPLSTLLVRWRSI